MATQIKKVYNAFAGENLRSPELLRNQSTATESLNVQQTDNLGMGKRKGHQIEALGQGGLGATTFINVNNSSGITRNERLVVGQNLHKIEENALFIAYAGTGTGAFSFLLNEDQVFEVKLFVDGEEAGSDTFSNGRTTSEPDVDDIVTYINTVTGFYAYVNSSDPAGPRASYVSIKEYTNAIDPEIVESTLNNFPPAISNQGKFAVAEDTGIIYIAVASNWVALRSNLVPKINPSIALGSLQNISGYLIYKTFEQVTNAAGVTNTFNGHWDSRNDNNFQLAQFAQTNDVLYITNKEDGLFKYDGARVYRAGLEDASELTLTTGAGALTGSYLYRYFYEYTDAKGRIYRSNISSPQEIELTSNDVDIDIPTIEDGSGYDTDGSRLKIQLLRTRAGGTVFYELVTLSNDGTVSSISYTDNAADSTINVDFTLPTNNPRQAPKCSYITVFRNKIVLTGNESAPNEVYFSDIESPEGFPIANRFLVRSRFGGPNSALESQDNFLYVFKPNAVSVVTGSLDSLQFEVDSLSDEGIGCVAANSIIKSQGKVYFLSRQGIYSIFNSQSPVEESSPHKPYYNNPTFNQFRVNSLNWIQERILLWSLPEFDETGGEKVLNKSRSKIVALDIKTDSWRTWRGLDISAGIALDKEDVWFVGSFEDEGDTVRTVTSQLLNLGSEQDYADHELPIAWSNATHWEHVEEPAIDKNFTRTRVYSVGEPLQNFTITGFDLTVKSNFNYSTAVITESSKSYVGGSQGYGEGPWGLFPWGDTPLKALQYNLSRRKCKSMRLIFENNKLHQNVLVTGYEIEVWAPYRPAIKGDI